MGVGFGFLGVGGLGLGSLGSAGVSGLGLVLRKVQASFWGSLLLKPGNRAVKGGVAVTAVHGEKEMKNIHAAQAESSPTHQS